MLSSSMPSLEGDLMLIEAVKSGREQKVKQILASRCPGNDADESGKTALHWAAEYGHVDVVCTLIASEWDVNTLDNRSQTPLLLACYHKRRETAEALILAGCDVNTPGPNDMTPLHRAVHCKLESIVCLLCQSGANVNARNVYQCTPLHEAMRAGSEAIVKKLIEHGADVNATSQNKMSPFLTAIFYFKIAQRNAYLCLEPILEILIKSGAKLGQSDGQWTPLSAAVNLENTFIAILLIIHGCKIEKPGKYSRSLLVEMFSKCDPQLVKLYVAAGYQVTMDEIEQCSKRVPTFSRSFLRLNFPGIDHGKGQLAALQWLRERITRPFSLYELSRGTVRKALNDANGDRSIISRISELPVPVSIQNFIALKGCIQE